MPKSEVEIIPIKLAPHRAGGRPTVVIVEQDVSVSNFYVETLCNLGDVDIECASDGFCGLIAVAETKPVMIISNLEMAKFDGFEMINILDRDPVFRWTKVIVIADLSDHEVSMRGGVPKNVIRMHKPISAAALEDVVVANFPDLFCRKSRPPRTS